MYSSTGRIRSPWSEMSVLYQSVGIDIYTGIDETEVDR